MARLFGALAGGLAKYRQGQFQREQYDAQQAEKQRAEQRRIFEFAATQDRLKEAAQLQAQLRQDALDRQRQQDVVAAQLKGYEDAPVESVSSAANAFLQSQGMGGGAPAVRAPATKPYENTVEGIPVRAAAQGAPRYATVGGRVMRYDPQREANAAAQEQERKLMETFAIKRDVAQQNKDNEFQRRMELAALTASLRPPPQGGASQNKPASEKLTADFATIKDIADQADYAISLLSKTKGAAGPMAMGGRLVRKLTMQDPTAGDISAAEYQRVTADLRKKLFGAAQSVRELRSASEFLPDLDSSNDAYILNALRGIGRTARRAAQNRLAAAQAGGRPVGDLQDYITEMPSFDVTEQAPTVARPDATPRPKGAPVPNRSGETDEQRAQRLINSLVRPK